MLGARDADIAKAALFLEAIGIRDRTLVRKQAVFHAANKNERKLEALGRVHRHELHAVFPGIGLSFAGFKRSMRQELVERGHFLGRIGFETFRSAHEFEQVLDAGLALLAFVLLEEIDEPAHVDHVIDLVLQGKAVDLTRHAFNQ